jgi:RNA recognition motif-containing protein
MPTKLYVGNLSHMVVKDDLQRLFASHGPVRKVEVTTHLKTGDAMASALVEMESEERGQAAIAALNGTQYRGHPLAVTWATTRQEKGVDLSRMFESMNIPDKGEGNETRGPHSGGSAA